MKLNSENKADNADTFGIEVGVTDDGLDSISSLAGILCNSPVSIIYKLEGKEVFVISSRGIDIKNISEVHSFYPFVAKDPEETLIVKDARKDARFKKNSLVTSSPGLVFYAGVPLFNSDGRFWGVLCVIDFKPRKLADDKINGLKILAGQIAKLLELKKSHAAHELTRKNLDLETNRLNTIIGATQVGTYEWDIVNDQVTINDRYAAMAGYSVEELLPITKDTWYRLLHPEDRNKSDSILEACFNKEIEFYNIEFRLIHKEGHYVWINDRGKVTKWSADGKPLVVSGTHTDITKRKNKEIQFQTISDNIPGVVFRFKRFPDGRNTFEIVSNGALHLWGLSAGQVMSNSSLVWDRCPQEDIKGNQDSIERSAEELSYWLREYRYHHPDGSLRWHKAAGSPHKLEDGSIVWDAVILDVTKRKQAEDKLEKTLISLQSRVKELECIYKINQLNFSSDSLDDLFQEAVDSIPLGWKEPKKTFAKITFGSKVYYSLGFKPLQLAHKAEYVAIDGTTLSLEAGISDAKGYNNESPFPNNEVRLLDTLAFQLGTNVDQLSSREAIRSSNEKVNSIIESIPGIFWESNSETFKISYISHQVKDILGYSVEEWKNISGFWQDHIYESDKDRVLELVSENTKVSKDFIVDYRLVDKNGKIVWVSDLIKVVKQKGKVSTLRGLMVDISEKKAAETALRKSDERFKALIENGRDAIIILDNKGVINYVSPSIVKVLGYAEDELIQRKMDEIIHPDDYEKSRIKFNQALASPGEPINGHIIRGRHKDGSWRWLESTMTNFSQDPHINGVVDNFRDITEQVSLHDQLSLSEQRFKALVQEGSDLTAIISPDGKYTYVSPNYPNILGYEEEDLIGDKPDNYFHPEDLEGLHNDFAEFPSKRRVKCKPFRYKRKNGTWCWLLSVATDLSQDPAVRGIVVNSMDITELLEAQEKLKTSEARYKGFYESQTNFVFRTDINGMFTYANNKYMETFGWLFPENTYLGANVIVTIPDSEREKVEEVIIKCLDHPEKVFKLELIKLKQEGGVYYTLWDFVCILGSNGQPFEIQCNGIDITERIAFEKELKKSNERFELVMQTDSGGIWDFDPGTGELFLGEGFHKNFGFDTQNWSKNYTQINESIHKDDSKQYLDKIQSIVYETLEGQWEAEYRLLKANKEYAYVKEKAIILRDEEGKAYRIVGSIKDITSEHFYRELETIEKTLMEASMSQGVLLEDLLNDYLSNLEKLFPTLKTGVFKVVGNKLFNMAIPSLDEEANKDFKEFEIYSENADEKETNNHFLSENIFVEDLKKDVRCKELSELIKKMGASSCWTLPIFNSDGNLVAAFFNFFERTRNRRHWESYAIQRSQRIFSLLLTKFEFLEGLHKSNERYAYVNRATNDAIYEWDIKEDKFHWGEGFYRIFGYDKDEEIRKISEWRKFMHPADANLTDEVWEDFLNDFSENRWHKEYKFLHKNGQYLFIEEIGYLIRDEITGRPSRMIGVLRDISAAKEDIFQRELQHEIGLHFNKNVELNEILNGVLGHICNFGDFLGGEIWLLNKRGVKINLLQSYWETGVSFFLVREIYALGKDITEKVLNTGEFFFIEDVVKDRRFNAIGTDIQTFVKSIIGIPLIQNDKEFGVLLLYGKSNSTLPKNSEPFFMSIGSVLGGEIKRKQQEEEMILLFKSAPELITIIEPSGHFVKVNPSFCQLLGYREEDILTKKFEEFIHPDDIENSVQNFSVSRGIKAKNLVNRYRTRTGKYRWISWNSSDDFGEEGLVFSFGHDITDMIELQTLFDSASKLSRVGSWEIELKNNKLFLSTITREILGLSQKMYVGWEDVVHAFKEEGRFLVQNSLDQAIQQGKSWDYQLPVIIKDGEERWVRSIGQAEFVDNTCIRIFGSLQDIHKQKSNEIELAKNNQLLEVISKVIGKFLLVEDWTEVLEDVFVLTSKTVQLDRIYYFKNHIDEFNGKELSSKKYDWYQHKIKSFYENEKFQNIVLDEYSQMMDVLKTGDYFIANTRDLPDCKLKRTLEEGEILSTLAIPIFIDNLFFGFIGFDDCTTDRNWTESEISFLLTVTSNLASAIQRSNSQLAMKRSFEEKTAILESIGEGFFTLDNHFTILYWNQRSEEIMGVSRGQALKAVLWKVIPGMKDSIIYKKLIFALESNSAVHFEVFFEPRNIWIDINVYPSSEGISVFVKDITGEKFISENIRDSNERFEKIAEATNDAIWDFDLTNNQLFRGKGFNSLFGHDLEKTAPDIEQLLSLIHPDDRERIILKFNEFINSDVLTNWFEEYRLLRNDGYYAFIIDRAIFIRDKNGKVTRVIGAMTDITYRKEYEESLQALNEQMVQYAKDLERSNKELEQFAYVASHDLQEPLRMVSNFMGLLERKYSDQLDPKAHQYIQFAVDGAKRMRQIILDLLEFSRIGKNEDKLKVLRLTDIVDEVCVLQKKKIMETEAIVKYENLPTVISYRTPLLQVFNNVIGNALKYRNERTHPFIEIKAEILNDLWHFSVEDNGIGIAPEYHENIFTIFNRLHNKEKYEGTGMGLAIVKKIIDGLGGEIWVESNKGEGVTFHFNLPKPISNLD